MRITITDVTPELAAEWLKQNTRNRPISQDRVAKYARDMLAGHWPLNGEAIKRAVDGTLLDGQQRLSAVVQAGVTVTMLVVEDLPSETQQTMDLNRPRTLSDNLGINGTPHAVVVAAITRRAWQWSQGNLKFTAHVSPTIPEMQAFLDANPSILRSAELAVQIRSAFRVAKPSVMGTTHQVLLKIDQDATALFFAQMLNGAGLETHHPVLTLRNRFLTDKITGKRNPFHQDVGLVFRAWNGVREGRSMAKIAHTADEPMIKPI